VRPVTIADPISTGKPVNRTTYAPLPSALLKTYEEIELPPFDSPSSQSRPSVELSLILLSSRRFSGESG
jgi:hypothetical protein